ncbi:MAG: trigger factor [Candidatus Paceibacterota bacterium]|jgi:trigger factor
MKTSKSVGSNGEIKISVSLEKSEAEICYKHAFQQIKSNFAHKGFRKGNVPESIIEKNAKGRIFDLYEEHALTRTLTKAIEKESIKPVLRPEVKILKSVPGDVFEYEVTVVSYPNIRLGKYQDLNIKKKIIDVDEQEIDKALEFLRQSRASFNDSSKPAEKDNLLDISFEAFFEGKKNEEGSSSHYPLRLGKSKLHPDFEKQLLGMIIGEKKSFQISFPKEWPQKDFAGKKIDFSVTLNSIKEVVLPTLNDEFAKSLGDFKNLDEIKKSLRDGLRQEKDQQETMRIKKEIFDRIIKISSIELPQILIQKEEEKIKEDFEAQLKEKNITIKDYLKQVKATDKELEKNFHKNAIDRLNSTFVINEIAKTEELFPKHEEVEKEINEWLKKSQNSQKSLKDIDLDKLESYTFEYLTNQKVIDWLLEKNICVN